MSNNNESNNKKSVTINQSQRTEIAIHLHERKNELQHKPLLWEELTSQVEQSLGYPISKSAIMTIAKQLGIESARAHKNTKPKTGDRLNRLESRVSELEGVVSHLRSEVGRLNNLLHPKTTPENQPAQLSLTQN